MRKMWIPMTATVAILSICWLAVARSNGTTNQAPADEAQTLVDRWLEAKTAGDATLIAGYLDNAFVGVGPSGAAHDRRAFVELLANPNLKITKVQSSEQSIRLHGAVVVVTGLHQIRGTFDGKNVAGTYRYVEVLRRTEDGWRLLSSTLTRVLEDAAVAPADR